MVDGFKEAGAEFAVDFHGGADDGVGMGVLFWEGFGIHESVPRRQSSQITQKRGLFRGLFVAGLGAEVSSGLAVAAGVVGGVFGGLADDDVEVGGEFAGVGIFEGFVGDDDEGLEFRVFDPVEEGVGFVEGFALGIELGGEEAFLFLVGDSEVDVRGAPAVSDGFDGAEVVSALGVGEEASVSLEVFFASAFAGGAFAVEVGAVGIGLPDFDEGVANGVALDVPDGAGEVSDFADGGGDGVVNEDEVVVGIEGEFVGVERAFGLAGGEGEGFGEGARGGEEGGGAEGGEVEEFSAVAEGAVRVFHGRRWNPRGSGEFCLSTDYAD